MGARPGLAIQPRPRPLVEEPAPGTVRTVRGYGAPQSGPLHGTRACARPGVSSGPMSAVLAEVPKLAARLAIRPEQAAATIALLDDGNTLPFIARYRKERTGGLDEE